MRTRRQFLKRCCALGAAGAAAHVTRLGLMSAHAQSTSTYKALVCVFMFGGNDANNMIVPASAAGYNAYTSVRGGLALPQGSLLPVSAQGGTAYGLHPQLNNVRNLYNQGKVAMIFNVGTLVRPTSKAQYQSGSVALPRNLYSHSDQQSQWQTSNPTVAGGTGWGGRVNDLLAPGAPFPPGVSVAGNSALLAGAVTTGINISPGSNFGLDTFGSQVASDARFAAMQQILTFNSGVQLIGSANGVLSNAVKAAQDINLALASGTPIATVFPNSGLGQQLLQVAKIIQVRGALGMDRQIFFASMGGFDNHSNLVADQAPLLQQLDGALGAFQTALAELGVEPNVVTFTESEFSRTGNASATAGSDHAWGGHHFVMGAPIHGGEAYGTFPTWQLQGPDDVSNRGVWLPTTSLDQYAATMASWFGVLDPSLTSVFPNLGNFATPKLAFL
ncbi:MAG: DUF1501 domain-containing protein [Bryobacterales bacterium]|nr:DUF1501 domain-containing protein [Bryobacterales bacterium]